MLHCALNSYIDTHTYRWLPLIHLSAVARKPFHLILVFKTGRCPPNDLQKFDASFQERLRPEYSVQWTAVVPERNDRKLIHNQMKHHRLKEIWYCHISNRLTRIRCSISCTLTFWDTKTFKKILTIGSSCYQTFIQHFNILIIFLFKITNLQYLRKNKDCNQHYQWF